MREWVSVIASNARVVKKVSRGKVPPGNCLPSYNAADKRTSQAEYDGTITTWSYDGAYQLLNERRGGGPANTGLLRLLFGLLLHLFLLFWCEPSQIGDSLLGCRVLVNLQTVVKLVAEPKRLPGQTRPYAVTVWVVMDGRGKRVGNLFETFSTS
jgi:hypothetical protein